MVFHDEEHGNTAMIEEVKIFPYKGAPRKQAGFRLIVSADYDEGFIYHISLHETVEAVKSKLKTLAFADV